MTYEIKNGIYVYINGEPLRIPHDENAFPMSVLYAISDNSKYPIPVKTTSDGKLIVEAGLSSISIGSVKIQDETLERYINIVLENDNSIGIKGFVLFGRNEQNQIKPFLFDLNGNLKVNDELVNLNLTEIKDKLNNFSFDHNQLLVSTSGLTNGTVDRTNDDINYIEYYDSNTNITKRTTFTRDSNGDIISWTDEII